MLLLTGLTVQTKRKLPKIRDPDRTPSSRAPIIRTPRNRTPNLLKQPYYSYFCFGPFSPIRRWLVERIYRRSNHRRCFPLRSCNHLPQLMAPASVHTELMSVTSASLPFDPERITTLLKPGQSPVDSAPLRSSSHGACSPSTGACTLIVRRNSLLPSSWKSMDWACPTGRPPCQTIILRRISSEPAFYQPQTSLMEPSTPFKGPRDGGEPG